MLDAMEVPGEVGVSPVVQSVVLNIFIQQLSNRDQRRFRCRSLEQQQPTLGEAESGNKQNRLVVDPELDAPFDVAFTLTVYDFGGGSAKAGDDTKADSPKKASADAPAAGDATSAPLQQGKEAK